jgi:hypothetical protein
MLPFCLLVLSGLQEGPTTSERVDSSFRRLLDQHYPAINPEQREVFRIRLATAYGRLPQDEKFLDLGLKHVEMCITHSVAFLKAMDIYRVPSMQSPELRPLVLPTEFYHTACSLAVQRVEGDVERLLSRAAGSAPDRERIAEQLNRLKHESATLLSSTLGSQEIEGAISKLNESVDQLQFVAEHPFYGFDRTLTAEEFNSLLWELREKMKRLPVVVPPSSAPDEESLKKFETEDENNQYVSSLEGRRSRIEAEINDSFRTYTRTCGSSSWQMRDLLQQNNEAARKWIVETQLKHQGLISRPLTRAGIRKNESTESRATVTGMELPPENREKTLALPVAKVRNEPGEQSRERGRWGLFVALVFATLLVIVVTGLRLRRRAAQ